MVKNTDMKKITLYISALCFTWSLVTGCVSDEDISLPTGPSSIETEAGYGEVVFTWVFPEDPAAEFVQVNYQNAGGEELHQKFSRHAETAIIAGLEERSYTFDVMVGDKEGNLSAAQSVTVTPNKPPHLFVAETVKLEPDFGSIQVLWENATEREVAVNVTYMDVNGQSKVAVFNSSDPEGIGEISDAALEEQHYEIHVSNPVGAQSAVQTVLLAPFAESAFDKSEWEVVEISAEEEEGQKYNLYDDDVSTIWHSPWSWSQPDYPHYFVIDLKEQKIISRVGLVNRQNDTRGMTKVGFSGSVDNENWMDFGEFDFEQINEEQKFRLSANPSIRYLKVTPLEGTNFFTFLAEVNIYGQ
ncbi:hypothetical protein DN752_16385 [Echinicola strongylocentroti]|uniref:F5/8 type C domain-containing protein n=2 Tax=Echinicola strongylocentroti TaxID=1795355 RepID=A0A2Z4IKV2_9BACT|nr:hypothetical protein DN752_16385 [Echinicola strongylocentroti]